MISEEILEYITIEEFEAIVNGGFYTSVNIND